jgi:MEMO1 family protein
MREPTFAGQFYPATESALRKALEDAFTGERGPGSLPPRKQDRKVVAAIVPHAGYQFSGACAAWAYHAIAASPMPDLFIILGPNHSGTKGATSLETWKTPLGLVRPDQEFVKGLVAKGSVKVDEKAFAHEHSLEVQLPFLQFSLADPEKLKFVPVMVSHDTDLQQLAIDLKETLVEQNKRAVFIVSSDFTHHGPDYHSVRFSKDMQEKIYELDAQMIDLIKARKHAEFLDFVDKELATVCGALPIALLLMLLKPGTAKLEQYYTSGDVLGNYKNSLSYAAIVFEEKGK